MIYVPDPVEVEMAPQQTIRFISSPLSQESYCRKFTLHSDLLSFKCLLYSETIKSYPILSWVSGTDVLDMLKPGLAVKGKSGASEHFMLHVSSIDWSIIGCVKSAVREHLEYWLRRTIAVEVDLTNLRAKVA